MSLFRRKPESEQRSGEDAGSSAPSRPAPAAPPEQAPAQVREPFSGSIEAPPEGALVGGILEVDARLAEGEANAGARLDWSLDGVEWTPLQTPGDDYELTAERAGEHPVRIAVVRSLERAEAQKDLLEQQGFERIELAPAEPSSRQGGERLLCGCDTSSAADGSCLLRLVTVSAAGEEVASPPIRVLIDNAGPEVSLRQEPPGEVLGGTATLVAEAEDEVSGVVLVELELSSDGESWRCVAEAHERPFLLGFGTEALDDGSYLARAVARDGRGNTAPSEPLLVEISNLPAAELVDPGKFLRGRVNLIARALDRRSTQMVFEIAPAGSSDWRALGTARAPFHLPVDTRRLVDGAYELRLESRTAAGRSAFSQRFGPYVVDNTPPSVEITAPPEGSVLSGRVEIVVAVFDEASGPSRVELSYSEEGEWRQVAELEPEGGEVRGLWNADSGHPGPCSLRAIAHDRAGNDSSQIIEVTVAPAPSEPESAPEPPEPAPALEPEREPPTIHEASVEASGRFGRVPSWDWRRLREGAFSAGGRSTESASAESGEEPEPARRENGDEAAPVTPSEPGVKGVAWRWKGPERRDEGGEGEPEKPEPEEEPEEEPGLEPELEEELEPESEPEPEEEPEKEPGLEPELEEELEPKPEPEEAVEPVSEPKEEPEEAGEPVREIQLVERPGEEPGPAEEKSEEDEEEAGSAEPERGSVVNFPRPWSGWDIWELSELVEEASGQDPARQEERRQILYYLRDHAALDGRIPPKFESLIYEAFGELLPDDTSA